MTANKGKKLKIAITGGIAVGKSTIADMIKNMGYEVFSADAIYAELLEDEKFVVRLSALLDIAPLSVDGKVVFDRVAAAKKVYDNAPIRKKFNEYTHKFVYERVNELFAAAKGKLVFFEIPLLFESGRQNDFDEVIVVYRDTDKRIESVVERDGKDEDLVKKIINSQFDYNNKIDIRHTVIRNDGDIASLEKKVNSIVEYLETTI